MHESVMTWVTAQVAERALATALTLEVGSYNVNGTTRSLFDPESYWGIDFRDGPGVDQIADAHDLPFWDNSYDVVVSTEMLEHAEDPERAVAEMRRVLHPGGLLLLTTRGPGYPLHDHPNDYGRRWDVEGMTTLLIDAGFEPLDVVPDPQASGVFAVAVK